MEVNKTMDIFLVNKYVSIATIINNNIAENSLDKNNINTCIKAMNDTEYKVYILLKNLFKLFLLLIFDLLIYNI